MIKHSIDRRTFVKGMGCCAVGSAIPTGLVSLFLPGLSPIPPHWLAILSEARFAPSPHNTQPWKLRLVSNDRAELLLDRSRTLPDEDLTGCFVVSALGMFTEACAMVGANLGYRATFEEDLRLDPKALYSRVGWITLEVDAHPNPEVSIALFRKRRTSRMELAARAAPKEIVEELAGIAQRHHHTFTHVTDHATIEDIMEYNLRAVVEDLNTERYNREIRHWFRYDEEEAARTGDGLSARCMQIPSWEFRMMARYPELATLPLVGYLVRERYRGFVGDSPQLGILSGEFFTPTNALRAGKMFMQLWIEMTRHNLFLHPFGNLVTNDTARLKLMKRVRIDNPWIVFRFGYSETPPESFRLPVEQLRV